MSASCYGDAVPQLYLSFPMRPACRSGRCADLRGCRWRRARRRRFISTLGPRDLSSVTEAGDRMVSAGVYKISIGEGQPGTGAAVVQSAFTIEGNTSLPE